jgi:hypothetical protein
MLRFACTALFVMLFTPAATGYIHFPPLTLPKMCKDSHHVRVLKVGKFDKDKGVVFEAGAGGATRRRGCNC